MSSLQTETDIAGYCRAIAGRAKAASRQLLSVSTDLKNRWLRLASQRILSRIDRILEANLIDMQHAEQFGLTDAQKDRLLLNAKRVEQIASGLIEVADYQTPSMKRWRSPFDRVESQ